MKGDAVTLDPQCFACKHLHDDKGRMVCDAFPEWIPDAILNNDHDHRYPYEGDHGIRFEPTPGGRGLSEGSIDGSSGQG